MTVGEALAFARKQLTSRNTEDAGLEAEVLLRYILNIDRTQLYLREKEQLKPEQEKKLKELLERRVNGVPLAYIIKNREFYGLDFYVDENVLIPRPETELLVDKALDLAKNNSIHTIADIGTGSGVIAITLALKLPEVKIFSTDISKKALAVALHNAETYKVSNRITFLQGDLVEPIPEFCDLIVANLPYVKSEEIVYPIAAEPHSALDGGREGLDVINRFCREVKSKLKPAGYVLMEIGEGQSNYLVSLLRSLYPDIKIKVHKELADIERVVEARIF